MKVNLVKIVPIVLIFVIFCNDEAAGIKGLGRIKKQFKKFFKGMIKESKKETNSEEYYDYDEVYAIRGPNGGYTVHGPDNHYAYDEGVDVYQIPKMWSGRLKIPNFMSGDKKEYGGDDRVVKGWDNRLGFRLSVPYLGDFQYLREIGPGKYTDKLGPGKFKYPGLNEKRQKQLADEYYYNQAHYGYASEPSYGHPYPNAGHSGPYDKSFKEDEPASAVITEDPFASLRNYPWNIVKR